MKRIEFEKDCVEPNETNEYNYMLDTSAFNTLAADMASVKTLEDAYQIGFRYYKMNTQDIELIGYGARKYQKDGTFPKDLQMTIENEKKQPVFKEIIDRLHVQNVSELAILLDKHAIVGAAHVGGGQTPGETAMEHIIENHGKTNTNKPYKQHHDALIAEGAIAHHCILVADDKHFRDLYNEAEHTKEIGKQAITTGELINRAKDTLQKKI